MPVRTELDSPQVYEMPAREPVGSEMTSPVLSDRNEKVSPLSLGEEGPPGHFDRNERLHRTYYNP